MDLKKYKDEMSAVWDQFVMSESANGNLFHTRKFLSYHPEERFQDQSVMVYDKGTLVCVMAACVDGDFYFSHKGSSCGGPIIQKKYYTAKKVAALVLLLNEHFDAGLSMRIPEAIFGQSPNDLILYSYQQTHKIHSELAVVKSLGNKAIFIDEISDPKTRTSVRKSLKLGFTTFVTSELHDYELFHQILTKNLEKHQAHPVHSLEEVLRLKNILNDDQTLVFGKEADGTISVAIWIIKASPKVWHPQYIASDYQAKSKAAVETTIIKCFELAREAGAEFFNLGISTENQGAYLNEGLVKFKEYMGTFHQNRYVLHPK
jgi:hypothetical protein